LTCCRRQAFAFSSGRHALRVQQRNIDREQKRLHVPLADRTQPDEPPPVMIAVVGPPKVRLPTAPAGTGESGGLIGALAVGVAWRASARSASRR